MNSILTNLLHPLTLVTFFPVVGALVILFLREDQKAAARWIALGVSLINFLFSLIVLANFNAANPDLQQVINLPWIPIAGWEIRFFLGVDGLSILLLLLTTLLTPISILSTWTAVEDRVKDFMVFFLLLETGMIGVFLAQDLFLFYIFWEFTLVPMYFLIGIWGGPNRMYAAVKFFLYTMAGSILMLLAILWLGIYQGSFQVPDLLAKNNIPANLQIWLFLAFAAAFAIKVPMWPLHSWLPDAHVEAPTGGSIVLAAIGLKLGAYGFLRFSLPIVPDAAHAMAPLIIVLSLIAVVYIGFVALVQTDMKKLVAYSSIAHMGFVTLGFFMFNSLGIEGALVQMISHGFVSGAMFFCIGVLYDRMHSRNISDYGGVVRTMPKFAAFFMLFAMANAGLPGTSGFVGEFMVILGAVQFNFWVAFLAATTLILGAAYTLWMYKRVVFGKVANDHVAQLDDVNRREFAILAVFALCVLAMGVYPFPFTEVMHASVDELLRHVAVSKL